MAEDDKNKPAPHLLTAESKTIDRIIGNQNISRTEKFHFLCMFAQNANRAKAYRTKDIYGLSTFSRLNASILYLGGSKDDIVGTIRGELSEGDKAILDRPLVPVLFADEEIPKDEFSLIVALTDTSMFKRPRVGDAYIVATRQLEVEDPNTRIPETRLFDHTKYLPAARRGLRHDFT